MATGELNAAAIAAALGNARRAGDEHVCTCPLADEHAHGDADPSLYLKDASDGTVLVHCRSRHSREQDRVLAALRGRGLWISRNGAPSASGKESDDYVLMSYVPPGSPNPDSLASFLKTKIEEKGKSVRECTRFDYLDGDGRWSFSTLRFDTVKKDERGGEKKARRFFLQVLGSNAPPANWCGAQSGRLHRGCSTGSNIWRTIQKNRFWYLKVRASATRRMSSRISTMLLSRSAAARSVCAKATSHRSQHHAPLFGRTMTRRVSMPRWRRRVRLRALNFKCAAPLPTVSR